MRHVREIVAAAAFGIALAPAYGADGIKAVGIAARTAPADIVTVGFQLAAVASQSGRQQNGSEIRVLTKAFEAKGIKVIEATETQDLPFNTLGSYGALSSGLKLAKHLSLQLTGFKQIGDIAAVLSENGISQNVSCTFDSSKFEAIRADLQREAIAKAIAQAQDWAGDAGVKTGGVIDLSVAPVNGLVNNPILIVQVVSQVPVFWNTDQNLIPPAKDGEPFLIKYTVAATVVLAVKPE
ncbi:MAG: SIMPL domain-containing protein [Rhodomicrobium sp.]